MKRTVQIRKFSAIILISFFTLFTTDNRLSAETYTIRYATLAPKGSTWAKHVMKMRSELKRKSNGRLKMIPYFGGSIGTEKVLLRKLKYGQLDMASFTGVGLSEILPEARVLELPLFFRNHREVDATVSALYPVFEQKLKKKGYVLAGWGEGGFVYLMSKKPLKGADDMKGQKIWSPQGDQLVKTMLTEYGLVPVFLGFESVLPQLQTGGLDAVFAPPLAAIGLQWFNEVNYYSDVRLSNATGATLISRRSFKKLPADLKKILKESSEKMNEALKKDVRRDNRRALSILRNKGIKKVRVSAEEKKRLYRTAVKVQNMLIGELYSLEIIAKAREARDSVR